jgi:peptidoglycan-associated lipoprotein
MKRSRSAVLAVHAAILVLLAVGCAKRPAMTAATSPAPTGAATAAGAAAAPPAAARPAEGANLAPPTATPPPAPAGTPAARPPASDFVESSALKDVYFDFDKSDIRPDAERALDADATWMKRNPGYLVLIEGHCDERGTNEYNLALGERRARATMNYLVSHGIGASRLTIVSYGEERPQCRERNEGCWAKNRRAHFLVKAQ